MESFVEVVRKKRRDEIEKYKSCGISPLKENDYKLIDSIKIERNGKEFQYEVRVDFSEVRFYIVKDKSSIYLSIYELYELFRIIHLESDVDIAQELQKIYSDELDEFEYQGEKYKFSKVGNIKDHYKINIPKSGLEITYEELTILLFLIQEKSNYLCSLSGDMKEFNNGLVNLLITLLKTTKQHQILLEMGWILDEVKAIFPKNKKEFSDNDIIKNKYYLTEESMKAILELES